MVVEESTGNFEKRTNVGEGSMESRMTEEMEIDLLELVMALLRKWWLIGIVAVGTAVAGLCFAKFLIEPTYESTTAVYVISRQNEEATTYTDMQLGTQLMKDVSVLAKSRTVAERVIEHLGLEMKVKELQELLTVSSASDTRILYLTVTHTDPAMAQQIANEVREVAAKHTMDVMEVEAVNVAEEANYPLEKAAPSITKYTLLGGLLGAFFVCAILVVMFLLDDTIKTPDDVEKYLKLSTIGSIPYDEETMGNTAHKKHKKKKK